VDINQVGDRPQVVVPEGAVVALTHPSHAVLFLVLVVGQVVAGEVDNGCAHPGEDVSVGKFKFPWRILVVAMGENYALLRAEACRNVIQRRQVSIIESGHNHLGFAGEIEVAGLDAPVRVAGVAPVVRFSDRADEELGVDQSIVATDVVRIHVIEGVGITQATAFVEVFLDVINQRLVLDRLALTREAKVFLADVLGCIETHTVVVHRVAEPVNPAGDELAGVFCDESGLVEIGILFRLSRVADKGSGVGGIVGCIGSLEAAVEFQDDVHQADELLVERAAVSAIGRTLKHAWRPLKPSWLAGVHPDVEILGNHAGVGAVVGAVAGVVENDVGINLQIHLVGIVHHLAQGGPGTVAGFPASSLGMIPEIKTVVGVVADIAAVSVGVAPADGGFARGRRPDGLVADFGDFRQTLVDFVPRRLEVLDDHLGLTRTGEDRNS